MIMSKLRIYSLGIVVKDKELDSKIVTIYPVEQLPLEDSILGKSENINVNKKDSFDKQVSVSIDRENTIDASWLSLYSSNKITAPDVVKNETVVILQYGDADDFYWVDIFTELGLRRKETSLHLFGNTPVYGEDLNLDNSYWYRISSHGKHIKLHTSDNDGELTTYDITIDTKEGFFELLDGRRNFVKLDSATDTLFVNTNKDIVVTNGRNITIDNGRNIEINNSKDISIANGGNINVTNTGTTSINSTGAVDLTCGASINITAATNLTETAINVSINGSASIALVSPAISLTSGSMAMSVAPEGVKVGTGSIDLLGVIDNFIDAVLALQVVPGIAITGGTAAALNEVKADLNSITG